MKPTDMLFMPGQKKEWRRKALRYLLTGLLIGGLVSGIGLAILFDRVADQRVRKAILSLEIENRDLRGRVKGQRDELGLYKGIVDAMYGKNADKMVEKQRAKGGGP
jgi:hypothetical protein